MGTKVDVVDISSVASLVASCCCKSQRGVGKIRNNRFSDDR